MICVVQIHERHIHLEASAALVAFLVWSTGGSHIDLYTASWCALTLLPRVERFAGDNAVDLYETISGSAMDNARQLTSQNVLECKLDVASV